MDTLFEKAKLRKRFSMLPLAPIGGPFIVAVNFSTCCLHRRILTIGTESHGQLRLRHPSSISLPGAVILNWAQINRSNQSHSEDQDPSRVI
ncbi:hypothetical protein MaudCBS49596_005711 [Microsporum audouinii]